MRKLFVLVSILLSAVFSFGQTQTYSGSPTTTTIFRGGFVADSFFSLPVRDTSATWFYNISPFRRFTILPSNNRLYYHNGSYWKEVGTQVTTNSNGRSRVLVTDSLTTLARLSQDSAIVVYVKYNKQLYYYSGVNTPVSISALGGGYWTPQNYGPNTNTTFIPASSQLAIGTMQPPVDSATQFMTGATVSITQNYLASANNPLYLALSAPQTGYPNGMLFGTYGNGIGLQQVVYVHSSYSKSASRELCYKEYLVAPEPVSPTYPTVMKGIACFKENPLIPKQFWSSTPLTNPSTVLFGIESGGGGQFTDFRNAVKLFVRLKGDVHFNGALYGKGIASSTTFTPDLNAMFYEYSGTGGDTCFLPNPADPDNLDRIVVVSNFGDGALRLSYPVYTEKNTSIMSIPAIAPDNIMWMRVDGTKYKRLR